VLDIPAEFYLDTIQTVFQEFGLARGRWRVADQLVRPQDIHGTALLTIEGETDDISGRGQTHAAHDSGAGTCYVGTGHRRALSRGCGGGSPLHTGGTVKKGLFARQGDRVGNDFTP
jgi:poly(3-hydroxybutyrate) depolymerase